MTHDYGEIFCKAVSELVNAELQNLQYDITKNCTVVDVSDRHRGKYKVSDGAITFEAYSLDQMFYEEGDQVLVNIPQGDYTNQKTILNKVITESLDLTHYSDPLDKMIKTTGDIAFGLSHECSIAANDKIMLKKILTINKSDRSFYGFTHLGVSADFKTLLNNYNLIEGTYGILFLIYSKNKEAYEVKFSSKDMLGNPYAFSTYFQQHYVFALPEQLDEIYKLEAYLYQDNEFKDGNEQKLEPIYITKGEEAVPNIFVNNLQIWLGYESGRVIQETLELTTDNPSYSANDARTVSLRWLHKTSENTMEILTPESNIDYNILWYQYVAGYTGDEEGGPNWKLISPGSIDKKEKNFTQTIKTNIKNNYEQIKVIGRIITYPLQNDPTYTAIARYESNIIKFENTNEETAGGTQYVETMKQKLRLCFLDNSAGNYFLYDQNGFLPDNSSQGTIKRRSMELQYNFAESGQTPQWNIIDNDQSPLADQIDSIQWEYPTENTMIHKPQVIGSSAISYAIENNWYPNRRNTNYIKCTVKINGITYVLIENLRFGTKGSSGTQNTFLLEMMDGKNAICIDDDDRTLKVRASLIDANGMDVAFTPEEAKKIQWKIWYPHLYLDIGNASRSKPHFYEPEVNDYIITLKISEDNETKKDIEKNGLPKKNYTILEARYKYEGDGELSPTLVAFLPIPMKTSDCDLLTGPTQVIYNHQGLPNFDNNSYQIIPSNNKISYGYNNATKKYDSNNYPEQNANPIDIYEQEKKNKDQSIITNYFLKVPPLYSKRMNDNSDIQDGACVYVLNNSTVIWSQPILIMQSQYDFAMLNEWDGSLTIDENNGTILATMIGAGRKNENNKFSGVLMGDIKEGTGLNQTETHTGVYGFGNGVMTYGLRDNGSAFFGAAGNARIEIDGTSGIIKSAGWIENIDKSWMLNPPAKDSLGNVNSAHRTDYPVRETGTLIDLSNGKLLMQGKDNNYIYFNNNNDGKLEMSLSSLDIKLADQNNASVKSYINASAKGIVSEIRRGSTYHGTCATTDEYPLKKVVITSKYGNDLGELNYDKKTLNYDITDLTLDDILIPDTIIAIKFENESTVKTENITENSGLPNAPSTSTIFKHIKRTGKSLKMAIGIGKEPSEEADSYPIYYNGAATNDTPSGYNAPLDPPPPPSNPFGWEKGTTLYFIYKQPDLNNKATGYWEVYDGGSYSKIIQTENSITSIVSNLKENISTSIEQTESSIVSQAKRIGASYACIGFSEGTNSTQQAKIIRSGDELKNITNDEFFTVGKSVAVTFNNSNVDRNNNPQYPQYLQIILPNDIALYRKELYFKDKPLSENNKFVWGAGETVYFIYNGTYWNISSSASYSKITQTAEKIRSEVSTAATFTGTCSTPSGTGAKEVKLKSIDNVPFKYEEGTKIAVTFINPEPIDTEVGKESITHMYKNNIGALELKINNNTHPVYMHGKPVGSGEKDSKLLIEGGSTLYFIYNDKGQWIVSEPGSTSLLMQTAEGIRSFVTSENGSLQTSIDQTEDKIVLGAARSGGLKCINTSRNHLDWNARVYTNTNKKITEENIVGYNEEEKKYYANDAIVLEVHFTNAITKDAYDNPPSGKPKEAWLKICAIKPYDEGENIIETDWKYKKQVHYNGKPIDTNNRLYCNANSIIYFKYVEGHWDVVAGDSSAQLTLTADNISASVKSKLDKTGESKTEAFSWNLTSNGFYINNNETAPEKVSKFVFNKDGLNVEGSVIAKKGKIGGWSIGYNDEYKGFYYRTNDDPKKDEGIGSFSTVGLKPSDSSTAAVLWAGKHIQDSKNPTIADSIVNQNTIDGAVPYNNFNIFGDGTVMITNNSSKGVLKIGYPSDMGGDWKDISLIPWGGGTDTSIGNLGTEKHFWDIMYSRAGTIQASKRNLKTNIAQYNIDNAYEELKHMPIYTYYFKGTTDVQQNNWILGTMIDYMPLEVQMPSQDGQTKLFKPNNLIFWNIAASQAIQEKLESLISRVEELEKEREELLFNGIN